MSGAELMGLMYWFHCSSSRVVDSSSGITVACAVTNGG